MMLAFVDETLTVLDQPMVEPALGAAAVYLTNRFRRYVQRRPLRRLWDPLIGDAARAQIVIANVTLPEFQIETTGATSELPANIPLMGAQEAVGVAFLRQALNQAYRKTDIEVVGAREYRWDGRALISVGGTSVNRATREVLAGTDVDVGIEVVYPEHYAIDREDGTEYRPELTNGHVSCDFGFLVVVPSPFDDSRICLIYGVWPPGSRAAAGFAADPDLSGDLGAELRGALDDDAPFVAVVRSHVSGLTAGGATLVKVRRLRRKREAAPSAASAASEVGAA